MKKIFKWILRIVIGLVVLVVIAAIVLPMILDPNDYKQEIETSVEEQIGRQTHLNGNIEWSVFPWLALTFNDVSIDNAKGFKGDSMASIEKLSARVKLLPLLSKDIEIGSIVIDSADINLQVSRNGKSNWQGILDKISAESGSETDSSPSSTSLNIEGVSLSNTKISYKDAQTNSLINVSELTMDMSEISKDTKVNTDVSMHLNIPDSGLDIDVNTDLSIENLIADQDMQIQINAFNANGKLSSEDTLPLDIELKKTGQLDLSKDTLALPELSINVGDAKLMTNVSATNVSSNALFSGKYTLAEFDLNNFFKQLSGGEVVSSDVFDQFSSTGVWKLSEKRLEIDNMQLNFDESLVKGDVKISDLDKMKGVFNLHITALNLDKFLSDDSSGSNEPSNENSPEIDFGQLKGTIKIDSMQASGATMQNITMQAITNGAKMTLNPVKADFYQGQLNTIIKVDTKAIKNKVTVDHSMTKIQAGPLLTDIAGSELLTGIGQLNMAININQPFSATPMKTAHGHIDYSLGDGAIYGVDVFGMIQQGLSMLYPETEQKLDDGIKKTTFALMQIDADIDAGILKTNVLKIESPYLLISGDISIDLNSMSIDGTIEPVLLDIPEQMVSEKYKNLLNIAIPVKLSGSLLEPSIKIDAKQLILNTQKERIDKEKDKLKGKLLDSLFGKDKKSKKEGEPDQQSAENKPESDKDKLKRSLLEELLDDGN